VVRERRRLSVADGCAKLREIMDARAKYFVFYVRRLRHGYAYYGDVLKEANRRIAFACELFRDLAAEIRQNLDAVYAGTFDFEAEGEPVGDEEEEEEEPPGYAGEPYVSVEDQEADS
jgi:hypothetical protein